MFLNNNSRADYVPCLKETIFVISLTQVVDGNTFARSGMDKIDDTIFVDMVNDAGMSWSFSSSV